MINIRFLYTSDWHTRKTNPRYRVDNYYLALRKKQKWIVDFAIKENCTAILNAGDLCDSPDQSNEAEIALINLLKCDIPSYVVFGQHDTKFRQLGNTTLSVLEAAGAVTILDSEPIRYEDENGGNINIYGASWEEEIPEVEDPKALNILVLHKMIVQSKPLWDGQKGFVSADTFLKKYKNYQLIVSGDNHNSFIHTTTNQTLINAGSLMRTTTLQRDHLPCVYVYDTETKKAKKHLIPIKPIEDVMDLETADEVKEKNMALDAFMEGLSSEHEIELKFEDNLKSLMAENKTPNRVKKLANSFLEKYYEGGTK